MNFKTVKILYWITFAFTITILPLNFGLGLVAVGIVILLILILHLTNGLSLHKLENHRASIILSAVNMLLFALARPDGVHAITDNGLSSLLDIFGINSGYNNEYENYYFTASIILLFAQLIMD